MNLNKLLKNLYRFAIKNYFISIFLACIAFVFLVSGYRLFFQKPTYIYVKVKMGQGLWWASTTKPPLWFIKSLNIGDEQMGLLGQPTAEIKTIRYYPTNISNQYDVYLTMKLRVSGNKKTGVYNFNRSPIGVGAPIDFEFPDSQFSGTIISLSDKFIQDKNVNKTVYLYKKGAPTWEFDAIKIGDKFFDGQDNVFEILDKYAADNQSLFETNNQTKDITVKAKIKIKDTGRQLLFGEEQVIAPGKTIYVSTKDFTFTNYIITKVE